MSRLTRYSHPDRLGFTLVELLVVLVLFGIIGTAMTRSVVKQQQYYKDQTGFLEGRRELRLGSSVLPIDLRSISTSDSANGSDLILHSEKELVMRVTIGTSIVCARTANTLTIPPLNLARQTLTSWYTTPQAGDTLFVYDENLLAGSEDDLWQRYAITSITKNTAACPGAPYTDPVLDPPATKPRYDMVLTAGVLPIPDSVKVGAAIRFTRVMRYRLEQVASGRWYLTQAEYANGAWGTATTVAGPYRAFIAGDGNPSGLQFRYYDTTGTRLASMLPTDRVGRVDVYMRTDNGAAYMTGRRGSNLQDSVMMRVAIRNSR